MFQPICGRRTVGGKPGDAAGYDAEAGHVRSLVAAVEEHLHADADAEKGSSVGGRGTRRAVEARAPQRLHARAERADAREHDRVGAFDGSHVGGQRGVGTEVLQCLLRRAQVADPVVDDRDARRAHDLLM